jgi:hypothetical protein
VPAEASKFSVAVSIFSFVNEPPILPGPKFVIWCSKLVFIESDERSITSSGASGQDNRASIHVTIDAITFNGMEIAIFRNVEMEGLYW